MAAVSATVPRVVAHATGISKCTSAKLESTFNAVSVTPWKQQSMLGSLLASKAARGGSARVVESFVPGKCEATMEFFKGKMSEGFQEDDTEFSRATVVEANEVKSSADGFVVKMSDGSLLKCAHTNPDGARLPDYTAQPAIVLKLEDGSGILLPIIVLDLPSQMAQEAIRNVPLARPTVYLVMRDMIDMMGYKLKLVRITHRVCEAYYARVYLEKVGEGGETVFSLDLRPSDAINLAIRARVPIQVNRSLAVGDGVRVVSTAPQPGVRPARTIRRRNFVPTEEDMPDKSSMVLQDLTAEFRLLQTMQHAIAEERFTDAAKIRDELTAFRTLKTKLED
ncbi:hypothetical protein CLOM_g24279 [Closterium sp. NIES-68]|nr:hypothetical protein CLOM_g24279 [Closterium sp. NIES-68]GJP83052.1 hypothetical protein CLOP_g13259 [Closterium sp. NIES-67]